ncbi:Por secretion system C-terminal sorting domain-containing protein [Gracilimonas mengyeensis]|uniref:Por secretion system C-terminal sorting domain-containing protein n=2 Tax=Gracilimonas mengyeensis TaxID=1302730 RepID=A0A521FAV7_9BACT|nr:Por secretion system C-terminal sorting domain-containing protein [Gracilimonas mengyeensis]
MRFCFVCTILAFLLSPSLSMAQISLFLDDFEDGSTDTLWNDRERTLWYSPSDTYTLNETGGVLQINYNRTSESSGSDALVFTPPEDVDVSESLSLRFSLKSDIATTLTLRVAYVERPYRYQEFEEEIPGDGTWHGYSFDLDAEFFEQNTTKRVDFFLDYGSEEEIAGSLELDNFKLGNYPVNVKNLMAEVQNGRNVQLSWSSYEPDAMANYAVYRGDNEDFPTTSSRLIGETSEPSFLDEGLEPFNSYFYKIIAIDTLGTVYNATKAVRAETYDPAITPQISITDVNTTEPGKYETFALELNLQNVSIYNPYDPEDIDVHAWFKTPSGDTLYINGFYDNYQNADQWRLYFSPDKVGTWEYQVSVADAGGTASTPKATFEATASEHIGPLKVSETNPNYLADHDDNFYFGYAVYYPWAVTETGLNRLEEFDLNMIGYWNSTYDNNGNGGGNRLVESMQSGLGRYDQQKLGRIEQILGWLEARDMKMMYAVWAHPFLRDGAPGWDPLHWDDYNPYQEIVTTTEFFTDSLAWEYQEKQYRYLIARLGHHRALGIWEIINEMHGTTGYINNPEGARQWVNKVHNYFKEHDPYQRPTTASFDGAENWSQFDIRADIANDHYYETQGYPRPYSDPILDGLYNVTNVHQELKQSGERPAMLGEAGYTSMFSESNSYEYTVEFHNAYWSGLAQGMASTPFWWDYATPSLFTDDRMETYPNMTGFVEKLDLANNHYEAEELEEAGANIYTMTNENGTDAFGWMRAFDEAPFTDRSFPVYGLETGSYQLVWYNTWDGETTATKNIVSIENKTRLTTPDTDAPEPDIAYRLTSVENGTEASSLNIMLNEVVAFPSEPAFTVYNFALYVTDSEGRFVDEGSHEVALSFEGEGEIEPTSATTENGYLFFDYSVSDTSATDFTITASANGLSSATVNDRIITSNDTEGKPNIPRNFQLKQNYPNPFNPSTVISYELAENSKVRLEVFDIMGRKVSTLVNGQQSAGTHEISFDAANLSSGVYLYRIQAGAFAETKRMILMK